MKELRIDASAPSRTLIWVPLIAGGAALVAVVALLVASGTAGSVWAIPFVGAYVGGVVAFWLRPDEPSARRLLTFGAIATVFIGSVLGLALAGDELEGGWWLGPANVGVQVVGLGMEAAMIALLAAYPNGWYGRRYEQRVVRVAAAIVLVVPLGLLVTRQTLYPCWIFSWETGAGAIALKDIRSPLYVEVLSFLGGPLSVFHDAALTLGPLTGAVLVGLRYRRLPAPERVRIRWPTYGLLTLLITPLAMLMDVVGLLTVAITDFIAIVPLALLPASIVIGLVKPDLFDVDRAMRRTVIYAPLWIAIAGAYIGAAAALGFAASGLGIQVAVLVTILATVLFAPIRRRLSAGAATLAYGETLSGAEMVRLLGQTLDHPRDPQQLTAAIAETVRKGLGVQWTRIRLTGMDEVSDGPADGQVPTFAAAMVHAGEHLGDIECGPVVVGRSGKDDREKLETLARQAAVVIHNGRLAAELHASRSRIVAAHDTARRQIERDIHDGAQQDLVALIARIGLARAQMARQPVGMSVETLDDLESEAREALENLRQLAAGIHPTELVDHGLFEAIEGRTARLPVDVTVECEDELRTTRFAPDVEGTAYFFVSEAVANAMKHTCDARVVVRMRQNDQRLEIEVADDGTGFDLDGRSGSGLRGLADRVAAIGGDLAVDTAPGRGTRLTARLPTGSRG
ncbi:MAG: histidine kinase [Pseudonocardia sp.]|nr:histidine kinase [Pseudonocardia sp.]